MTSEIKQKIEELTAEAGFCEFKLVPSDHIIFNKNVRDLCEQECQEHEIHSWSLPPVVGFYEECYEKCRQYPWALLVSAISMTHDIMDMESWMQAGVDMNGMILQLTEQLKPYMQELLPLGMRCRRCLQCTCPTESCRHPETMLPATEGYGIHIMNTMEQEGITGYFDGQTIVCFGVIFLKEREKTLDFYNQSAAQYFQTTVQVDMSQNCDRFLQYLSGGASIVDIGAGSGRDSKYFLNRGYAVDGIDASEELCKLASEYTGISVQCVKIQNWNPEKKYDGVWANASLLHLEMQEIEAFFLRLKDILCGGGYAYISMKSGIQTGMDEKERYFTNFTKIDMEQILKQCPELQLVDYWETGDGMAREGVVWGNYIIQVKTMKERTLKSNQIHIEPLPYDFSVCKVIDYSKVNLSEEFCFTGKTDEENSLVCKTAVVPDNCTDRDDGWKAFRIKGTLEFSLIGILAGITAILAEKKIGVFALSTFNTDYVLVKDTDFENAWKSLKSAGYSMGGNTFF